MVNGDRFLFSLHPNAIDLLIQVLRRRRSRGLPYQHAHAIILGQPFQARTQVHSITQHGIRLSEAGSHVADAHLPRVDTHPDAHLGQALLLERLIERAKRLEHGQARLDRPGSMALIRHRRAPECHHGVPDVLVDGPLPLMDDLRHRRQVLVQHLGQLVGRQPL